MNVSYPLLWFRAAASLLWGCPCPGLPDVPVVPQPYPQALTICRLCCWCTLASSSAWRFCCLRSCACSVAGSRQPSSRATRFFSLSHMATWAYRENRALLPRAPPSPLISGLPQGRVASFWGNSFYPPQPLPTPTGGNLMRILPESLQLLELLQLETTGPGSLQECRFPARRRVSWAHRSTCQDLELLRGCTCVPGCPSSPGSLSGVSVHPDSEVYFEAETRSTSPLY